MQLNKNITQYFTHLISGLCVCCSAICSHTQHWHPVLAVGSWISVTHTEKGNHQDLFKLTNNVFIFIFLSSEWLGILNHYRGINTHLKCVCVRVVWVGNQVRYQNESRSVRFIVGADVDVREKENGEIGNLDLLRLAEMLALRKSWQL